MAYNPTIWINDDGSGTVGTPATANNFNNMEQGIVKHDLAIGEHDVKIQENIEQINVFLERGYLADKEYTSGSANDIKLSGKYFIRSGVTDMPTTGLQWHLEVNSFVSGYCTQVAYLDNYSTPLIYTRTSVNNIWSSWQQIATTTKTVIDLPLGTGITNTNVSKIVKNGINQATVYLNIKKSDGSSFVFGSTVATIPVGYKTKYVFSCSGRGNNGSWTQCSLIFDVDGSVICGSDNMTELQCCITYDLA